MNLIVCFNQKNVIGVKNAIPWHLPSDLKRFKQLTQGHIIVMGRKTYESLPVKPLPNRINIVITSNPENFEPKENLHFIHITYAVPFLHKLQKQLHKEIFIIGGNSIYEHFFPYCNTFYITKIYNNIEGDTYFPYHCQLFENKDKYSLLNVPMLVKENEHIYSFLDFKKIN
jgi:dihydrofolate reductase